MRWRFLNDSAWLALARVVHLLADERHAAATADSHSGTGHVAPLKQPASLRLSKQKSEVVWTN
jgi:hypothetical protein